MKQLTEKETLIKIYNEILEKTMRNKIDIQFFLDKAANYKKKSPEYKQEIARSKEQEGYLFWNSMLLRTINNLIKKYE